MPSNDPLELDTGKECQSIFCQLDTDGSGFLSRSEVTEGLRRLGAHPSYSEGFVDALCAAEPVESRRKGISETTFVDFICSQAKAVDTIFSSLDTDNNGVMSRAEVAKALACLGKPHDDENISAFFAAFGRTEAGEARHLSQQQFRRYAIFMPPDALQRSDLMLDWIDMDDTVVDTGERAPQLRRASQSQTQSQKTSTPVHIVLLAGGAAGMVGRTCTAPLDRLKILLQAGKPSTRVEGTEAARAGRVSPTLSGAFRHVLKDGGVRGFWRGNGVNVVKVMPESALRFATYDVMNALLAGNGEHPLSVPQRFVAGSVAGAMGQVAIYPLDFVKTRLAASAQGQYKGVFDVVQRTLRGEGVRALYRGLGPALCSIVPAVGVELTAYHTLKEKYQQRQIDILSADAALTYAEMDAASKPPLLLSLTFGGLSAVCGAVTSYPLALVRTKMITQGMPGRPMRYQNALHCLVSTLREEGPIGLYRGQVPSLMKTAPAIAIGYGVFEAVKNALS